MSEVTTNEIMEFLQKNMLTKEDGGRFFTKVDGDRLLARIIALEMTQANFATKQDLFEMKSEIMEMLDKLAKNQGDLGAEMAAMRSKYDRLEARLTAAEKKVGLAARA